MLALGVLACSGEDDTAGDGGAGQGGAAGAAQGGAGSGGVDPQCAALVEGNNTGFLVDGEERSFILNLPTDAETNGPWPVVFNWHGLGDTAASMSLLISSLVDDPAFPFIGVTPEDTNLQILTFTLDWDTFQVDPATNKEVRLFDEVLACLDARFGVDADRVHSTGFSLGGIVTDMLGATRGDRLASTATYSGAYFSNPDNVTALGVLSSQVSWPAPAHGNSYPQMIMHGGAGDTYSMGVATLHFDQFAANDQLYLNGMGHDVVLCDHGGGHTAPAAGMYPAQVVQFFRDHPRGTSPSPYAGGLPPDFSTACVPQPAAAN
jgi:poly(3-hydroxybutyrate) depolymerase